MASLPSPATLYRDGVGAQRWEYDPAQAQAVEALDFLQHRLLAWQPPVNGPVERLQRLLGKHRAPASTGLYLWGPVGRGKTFLMDLFMDSLPEGMAMRRHFHQFMEDVHTALRTLQHKSDPLADVAAGLARHAHVLCLDEFLVDDIGDAMILYGLLRGMVSENMVLVTTSNTPPEDLYRDGLQRARFIPAIKLLETHCRVLELSSQHDWRLRALRKAPIYQTPPGPEASRALTRIFNDYARGETVDGGHLDIHGRSIPIRRRADNIVWFDFDALCDGPRSRADYTTLANRYPVLVVSNVPPFTPDNNNPARRFIHLVDALYDRRVKLVLSAAAPIVDLYEGDRLRAEFARTESRLIEMQSADYLGLEHRPASP